MGGQVMNRLLHGCPNPKDLEPQIQDCPHCVANGEIYYWADTGELIPPQEYMNKYFQQHTDREIIIESCKECEGKGWIEVREEEPDHFEQIEKEKYQYRYYPSKVCFG